MHRHNHRIVLPSLDADRASKKISEDYSNQIDYIFLLYNYKYVKSNSFEYVGKCRHHHI